MWEVHVTLKRLDVTPAACFWCESVLPQCAAFLPYPLKFQLKEMCKCENHLWHHIHLTLAGSFTVGKKMGYWEIIHEIADEYAKALLSPRRIHSLDTYKKIWQLEVFIIFYLWVCVWYGRGTMPWYTDGVQWATCGHFLAFFLTPCGSQGTSFVNHWAISPALNFLKNILKNIKKSCAAHACPVPVEVRRGHWVPWNWS